MNRAKYILMLALLVASQLIQAQHLFPYQNNKGKWGYKDNWGKVKIRARYSTAAKFQQDLAVVSRKQKYGVIDTRGKRVLKRKYAAVEILSTAQRLFKVQTALKYGVVGVKEKVYIPIAYAKIQAVRLKQPELGLILTKANKQALYTYEGKALTGFDYEQINTARFEAQRVLAKKNGLYGYLNSFGKEVIPFVYTKAANFVKGQALVSKGGKSFVINEKGETLRGRLIVETRPEPEGGLRSFYRYISRRLRYPSEARRKGVAGRVYIRFDINTDGTVGNVRVLRGIGSGCDKEAVRIIKNGPQWVPGTQRGRFVKTMMTIPITFKLR